MLVLTEVVRTYKNCTKCTVGKDIKLENNLRKEVAPEVGFLSSCAEEEDAVGGPRAAVLYLSLT